MSTYDKFWQANKSKLVPDGLYAIPRAFDPDNDSAVNVYKILNGKSTYLGKDRLDEAVLASEFINRKANHSPSGQAEIVNRTSDFKKTPATQQAAKIKRDQIIAKASNAKSESEIKEVINEIAEVGALLLKVKLYKSKSELFQLRNELKIRCDNLNIQDEKNEVEENNSRNIENEIDVKQNKKELTNNKKITEKETKENDIDDCVENISAEALQRFSIAKESLSLATSPSETKSAVDDMGYAMKLLEGRESDAQGAGRIYRYSQYLLLNIENDLPTNTVDDLKIAWETLIDLKNKEFKKEPILKKSLFHIENILVANNNLQPQQMIYRGSISIPCQQCSAVFEYLLSQQLKDEESGKPTPHLCMQCSENSMASSMFKKSISDEVRRSLDEYGIDFRKEIQKLFQQIANKNYFGIKKLNNTRVPLFRKRMPHNTRLLFDFGPDWIRLWRFAKRRDVYRRIPSKISEDPILKIYGCDINDSEDNEADVADEDVMGNKYKNYEGVRFYSIPKDQHLLSDNSFKKFIEEDYQYHIQLAKEQETFIEELCTSPTATHLIQGAAGSGKSVCGIEYAIKLRQAGVITPILFLVPTPRLSERFRQLLGKRIPDCIYEPESDFNLKKIHNALKSKIVVLTTSQFYKLCFSYIRPEINSEHYENSEEKIKDNISRWVAKHHNSKLRKIAPEKIQQIFIGFIKSNSEIRLRDGLAENNYDDIKTIESSILLDTYASFQGRQGGRISHYDRLDLVREISLHVKDVLPSQLHGLNIIIDEAQDLTSEELRLIFSLYKNRYESGFSKLILLGDMNQRVSITDFEWARVRNCLHNMKIEYEYTELVYNYRSTKEICSFAHYVTTDIYKETHRKRGTRWLPTITEPEKCAYSGASPFLIVSSLENLLESIDVSCQDAFKIGGQESGYSRYAIVADSETISRVKPLIEQQIKNWEKKIVLLSPVESKGIEFDTVIILNAIPSKNDEIIEITKYYTSITRARHNLVIFLEEKQYTRFVEHGFLESNVAINCFIKNPKLNEIINIIKRVGVSRLTTNDMVNVIRELINNNILEQNEHSIKQIVLNVEELLQKSMSTDDVEELLFSLFDSCWDSRQEYIRNLVKESKSYVLKAILEKYLGNMFQSVVYWKMGKWYIGSAQKTINQLEMEHDPFKVLRCAALVKHRSMLIALKNNLVSEQFMSTFNRIVGLSSADTISTDYQILLRSIDPLVSELHKTFSNVNYSISQGVKGERQTTSKS